MRAARLEPARPQTRVRQRTEQSIDVCFIRDGENVRPPEALI
jgi:hypothetical protein